MNKRQKKKQLSYAAKMVLAELMKVDMFRGKFQAHGGWSSLHKDSSMFGIEWVMDNVAYMAGEKVWEEFNDEFNKNYMASVDAYEERENEMSVEDDNDSNEE